MKEILRLVVIEYKICSIEYFFDRMKMYELEEILEILEYSYKQEWEQTRFNSFITAQMNSTKKIKPQDIIKFSWENDSEDNKDKTISDDDIKRLKEKSELMKKYL